MKKTRLSSIALAVLLLPTTTASASSDKPIPSDTISEVVVTGSGSRVRAALLPYSVSVLRHGEIEAMGRTRVLDALSGAVPSLFVTQRGILGYGVSNGGAGHIKMRGVGGDRASATLLMVDGQPQFAGIYSHHIADCYTTDDVERVEVLRGPGSVLYGSNAMAGVINIITRVPASNSLSLYAQGGSYGTWRTALTATARYGKASSATTVSYDRSDGTVPQFGFRQWQGSERLAYDINRHWRAGASLSLSDIHDDDPIYPRLKDPRSTDIYSQHIIRGSASASLTHDYGTVSGRLLTYGSWGNHFIDDPRHFHSLDDRFGLMVSETLRLWPGSDITVGFDFDTYSGRIPVSGGKAHTSGSLSTIGRKSITEYSPYAAALQQFFGGRIVLSAGLRIAMSDRFSTHAVPQVGLAWHPAADWTLRGSVASGYRNPSFRELYLYKMANADLNPERLTNYELTLSKAFGHIVSLSLTVYLEDGHDMIEQRDMRNENTGSFTNRGIEFEGTLHPMKSLSLRATSSYLTSSLRYLTAAPRHQYYIGASWTPCRRLQINADLRGAARLYVAEDVSRQSFALVGLGADWHVAGQLSLNFRLDNLANKRYYINKGYLMPGFTAMGGVNIKI